jgi:uncharacterized RDD family membrane protein YckC
MPTADDFWQVATQVASERGGLVVGFSEDALQPELGSTLDSVLGFKPRGSATIVSLSNWMDWKEQVEAFYRLRPSWGRGKVGDPNAKYYRVRLHQLDGSGLDSVPNSIADSGLPNRLAIPSFAGYAEPTLGLQGATFWPRAFARLIDSVVHYLVGFIAGRLFFFLLTVAAGGRPPLWVLLRLSRIHFPTLVAGLLGSLAYQVICASVHGSTLGKLLLSLQVVQDDGAPCRPRSAVIRELAYFVDALFFGIIAYTSMQGDPQQKRHGDDWAHTVVGKRSDVPEESRQGPMRFVLGFMLGTFADIAFLMVGMLVQMNSSS